MKLNSSKAPITANGRLYMKHASNGVQTFSGMALGNFSVTNTVASAVGQIQDFGPGKTLFFIFQSLGTVNSTTENVLSCSTGAFTSGKGWWLTRAGTASGGTQKWFYLLAAPNHFVALAPPPDNGVSMCCLIWKSDNSIYLYMNGAQANVSAGFSCTAPDNTSRSRIGSPDDNGSVALTSGRVLAYALWSREASFSEAQNNTHTTGSRFQLPVAVTGDASCTVNFLASRDYNASGFNTLGSSPITYAVTGSPTLYRLGERRILLNTNNFWDGHRGSISSSFARVRVQTDAPTLAVESYSTLYSTFNIFSEIGLYVNGSYVTRYASSQQTTPQTHVLQPGTGSAKLCDIWEGGQVLAGTVGGVGGVRAGTYVTAIRLPLYLADGTTSANSSIVPPTSVARRLVLFGDSINLGAHATPLVQSSPTALARADFPSSGTGGITCISCGNESIANVASTQNAADATATSIISECNGTSRNDIWIALCTNDYGFVSETVAIFEASLTRLVTAIQTRAAQVGTPSLHIYLQSAIQRISPASEVANGVGNTLPQYRTAMSNVATALGCTYIEGAAGAIVTDSDMNADGIHIKDAVAAGKIKAKIKTVTGY